MDGTDNEDSMIYALTGNGKCTASPKSAGKCPGCGATVIAKCGSIKQWHWAHESVEDCDTWTEPETPWHANWKAAFDPACVEVSMGAHRADIKTASGLVVELQHSTISAEDVREREQFYGRMIWIIDVEPFAKNILIKNRETHVTFHWRWARPTWLQSRRRLFIDLRDGYLLEIKKVKNVTPCHGWGAIHGRSALITQLGGEHRQALDVKLRSCVVCGHNCCWWQEIQGCMLCGARRPALRPSNRRLLDTLRKMESVNVNCNLG